MKQYPQLNVEQLQSAHLITVANMYQVSPDRVVFLEDGISLDNISVVINPKHSRHYIIPNCDGEVFVSLERTLLKTDKREEDIGYLQVEWGNFAEFVRSDFSTGFSLVMRNEAVRYNGLKLYWDGQLPKTVKAGQKPEETGGIGKGAWMPLNNYAYKKDVVLLQGVPKQEVLGDLYAKLIVSGLANGDRTYIGVDPERDKDVVWTCVIDGKYSGDVKHPKKSGIIALTNDLTDFANKNKDEIQRFKSGVRANYLDAQTGENYVGLRFFNLKPSLYISYEKVGYNVDFPIPTILNEKFAYHSHVLGIDQKYQNMTQQRKVSTQYTNNSEKPISVVISVQSATNKSPVSRFYVDGQAILTSRIDSVSNEYVYDMIQVIIPPKSSYSLTLENANMYSWYELK